MDKLAGAVCTAGFGAGAGMMRITVDAYFGPAEWRAESRGQRLGLLARSVTKRRGAVAELEVTLEARERCLKKATSSADRTELTCFRAR